MNVPVLPRLYAGSLPLLRAVGVLCSSLVVGLVAFLWMLTGQVPDWAHDRSVLSFGLVSYLPAGAVSTLALAATAELRTRSFAGNLPNLHRRIVRESLAIGLITVAVASILAVSVAQALDERLWLASTCAALGYSVGILNGRLEERLRDPTGALRFVVACLPLWFLPELKQFVSVAGPLSALAALVPLVALAWFSEGSGSEATARIAARRSEKSDEYVGVPAKGKSAVDGSARFHGTRRSDRDWLRARLHQAYGSARAGMLGSLLKTVAAIVVLTALIQALFLGALVWRQGGESATPVYAAIQSSALAFDTLVAYLRPGGNLISISCPAILAGFLALRSATPSPSLLFYPLSRQRRARLEWWAQLVEELVALLAIVLAYALLTLIASQIGAEAPWPAYARWTLSMFAVFSFLPPTRWLALRLMRGAPVAAGEQHHGRDLRWNLVFALCFGLALGGGQFVTLAGLNGALDSFDAIWKPAASLLAAFVLGHLLWRWSLARWFARRDL